MNREEQTQYIMEMERQNEEFIAMDREEQYAEMYYALYCNICGEDIFTIESDAFNHPGLMTGPESIQHSLHVHNETHYKAPIIYGE